MCILKYIFMKDSVPRHGVGKCDPALAAWAGCAFCTWLCSYPSFPLEGGRACQTSRWPRFLFTPFSLISPSHSMAVPQTTLCISTATVKRSRIPCRPSSLSVARFRLSCCSGTWRWGARPPSSLRRSVPPPVLGVPCRVSFFREALLICTQD